MIYFTADLHLGHRNIIHYCDRPFDDVNSMNEKIISNWNDVVNPSDTVYVLGDFSMVSKESNLLNWFDQLQGKKILIKGNHDSKNCLKLPWVKICDVMMLKHKKHNIWLSHYAHRTWPKAYHGSLHLFGHSHGGLPKYKKSMDIGVDDWDFRPVSIVNVIQTLQDA